MTQPSETQINNADQASAETGLEIAIIGMAGRFPGANDIEEFWQNLSQGLESIRPTSEADKDALTAFMQSQKGFVDACAPLDGAYDFDASFFGYSPGEAELMDPQQRVFLQCAWHALENAGYDSARTQGPVGVFGAAAMNTYLLNLVNNPSVSAKASNYEIFVANDKDFLATRTAYKLNLKGPAVTVQTACSSSLVAVHTACQSLLAGDCDMALAGGVSVSRQGGYIAEEGSILSADGHCRAFDQQANGTVSGNGVGIVVLKRLEDALACGDKIDAVIKGSAINNDGGDKISFTAPQVDSQAEVIQAAWDLAEVSGQDISYIEAHGTATALGDPIEIAALNQAFKAHGVVAATSDTQGLVKIGSVKSNIGHLDTAAGIAGLIKTVLALKHQHLPASLHYQAANPQIDFASGPLSVNAQACAWESEGLRIAGVSSFGIGGTNAHLVVSEAPANTQAVEEAAESAENWQILPLSARSSQALKQQAANLSQALAASRSQNLAATAFTLQEGRRAFEQRASVIAKDVNDAIEQLDTLSGMSLDEPAYQADASSQLVMQFSGQGSQYLGMAAMLYQQNTLIRNIIDECCDKVTHYCQDRAAFATRFKLQLLADIDTQWDAAHVDDTEYVQPALFVIEYALAKYLQAQGLRPAAVLGHSIGEITAATIAGVFDLDTALQLVLERARLMQNAPSGAMLTVYQPAAKLRDLLAEQANNELVLAAVNGPDLSVVAGSHEAIEALAKSFKAQGVFARPLKTSHAFHSPMMQTAAAQLEQYLQGLFAQNPPQAPSLPLLSNLSGDWMSAEQAQSPSYWSQQLLATVQYHDCLSKVAELAEQAPVVLLEVGPQRALNTLAKQQFKALESQYPIKLISCLQDLKLKGHEHQQQLQALAQLWQAGFDIDWAAQRDDQHARRIALPGYPFEAQTYRINQDLSDSSNANASSNANLTAGNTEQQALALHSELSQYFYRPSWQTSPLAYKSSSAVDRSRWLILAGPQAAAEQSDITASERDFGQLADEIYANIEYRGEEVAMACHASTLDQIGFRRFGFDTTKPQQYSELLNLLTARELQPSHILVLWPAQHSDVLRSSQYLQHLLNALADAGENCQVILLSEQAWQVSGTDSVQAEQAWVQGLAQISSQENPHIACRQIDIDSHKQHTPKQIKQLAHNISAELYNLAPSPVLALRGDKRWQQSFAPQALHESAMSSRHVKLAKAGNYLIIGDIDQGLGKVWGAHLYRELAAQLVLIEPQDQVVASSCIERWQNQDSKYNCQIQRLSCNISDPQAISQALQQLVQQGSNIDGVFYSTPMTNINSAAPLALLSQSQWQYNQQSKVQPLNALAQALATLKQDGLNPAFVCVQSSMSAVVGGLGLAAYSSANQVLDAIVEQQNQHSDSPWFSINWDACFDAMPEDVLCSQESEQASQDNAGWGNKNLNDYAISAEQVWQATLRILTSGTPGQTAVSAGDLNQRIAQWINCQPRIEVEQLSDNSSHKRPELKTEFLAPRNDVEATVASIFCELLAIEEVGVNDDFYDLGGHSLMAIRAVSKLRDAYPVNVEMRDLLFESPTVARIAEVISEQLPNQDEMDEMAALLAEVQGMSDEELEA